MNGLAELLTSFDVSILFAVAQGLATAVGTYLSPVLLILAIYIRLMETQIDALVGAGKYGTALRDMLIWSFVLGAYYSIGNYIFEFMNPIYAWLDSFGSLKATMTSFEKIIEKNRVDSLNDSVSIVNVMSSPYLVIAMLLYYASLVVVAFMSVFLKIANVMTFGIAFIWGLIAIPVSISTTFKILRGWGYLLAFALVWPIVQGLLMAMFAMLFTNAADSLMTASDPSTVLRAANIMMLFAVMHLLLGAVMVSAPFIANSLVTNTPAAGGIVLPFVGAAATAALASIKGQNMAQSGLGGLRGPSGPGGAGAGSTSRAGMVQRVPTARGAGVASASPVASPASSAAPAAPSSRSSAAPSTSTAPAPSSVAAKPAAAPARSPATPVAASAVPGGPNGGGAQHIYRQPAGVVSAQASHASAVEDATASQGPKGAPDAPEAKAKKQQQRRGVFVNKRNNQRVG